MASANTHKSQYVNDVTGPNGRLIFPHIVEPEEDDKGNLRYKSTCLVKKGDPKLKALKEALLLVGQKGHGARHKKLNQLGHPLRDGDAYADEWDSECADTGKEPGKRDMYRGHVFFTATSKKQPRCYGMRANKADAVPRIEPEKIYGGCYGRLVMTAMSYSNAHSKVGVSLLLEGVQFQRDGDPLGGGASEESVTNALDDDDSDLLDDDDLGADLSSGGDELSGDDEGDDW